MTKRIEYIDYLKGLSIIWVVWYHTIHPVFVDYSFRIPLFFFVSGIFFKSYPIREFVIKKINTLVIPFVFFYLCYYLFYIFLWFVKFKNLHDFDFGCILQIWNLHKGFENFIINPPLWFICALLNLQILLYISIKFLKKPIYILLFSLVITIVGIMYFQEVFAPFMLLRSFTYYIYYTLGYLIGKWLCNSIEKYKNSNYLKLWKIVLFILIIISCIYVTSKLNYTDAIVKHIINYTETIALIIILVYLFSVLYKYHIFKFLKFYGQNSYIVLGIHEIYHTINYIIIVNIFGEVTIVLGIIQTIITLLLLWPTIIVMNRYIPKLIGKSPLFNI